MDGESFSGGPDVSPSPLDVFFSVRTERQFCRILLDGQFLSTVAVFWTLPHLGRAATVWRDVMGDKYRCRKETTS